MFARQNTSSLLKQVCGLLGFILVGLDFFYNCPNLVILQKCILFTVVLMKMSCKCCLLLVLTENLVLVFHLTYFLKLLT